MIPLNAAVRLRQSRRVVGGMFDAEKNDNQGDNLMADGSRSMTSWAGSVLSRKVIACIGMTIALVASPVLAQAQDDEPPLDMRILVDVSGSMQENDPDNLRVPAVNLLIELLPAGSRAGLWAFGREVNMLIPYGTVDDEWRELARERAAEIGSPGFNSNIGGALERSSFDFDWSTGFNPKEYLLLSDGVVDIPPDEEASRQERSRILNEMVPRFAEHNATIHTVRLSENSGALFMEQLAAQTGGNNRLARGAEDILALFLQLLDIAVGGQEEVALDERQTFLVDDSISEFTATILHDDSSVLTLIAPDGERYTQQSPPNRAEWLTSEQYDLITIRQPLSGEWEIEGELSPQSRIAVISDLNLQVDTVPLNAAVGAELPLRAVINDVDGLVTDEDFLDLMTLSASLRQGESEVTSVSLSRDDAEFMTRLSLPDEAGAYRLVVEADGQTFQRQRVYTLNVRAPVSLEVESVGNAYELSLYPNLPGISEDISRLLADIEDPEGDVRIEAFEQQPSGRWRLMVEPYAGDGEYEVDVDIQFRESARILGGLSVDPVTLRFPVAGAEPVVIETRQLPESEPEPPPEPEPVPEPEPEPTPEPAPEESLVQPPEPDELSEMTEPEAQVPDLDTPVEEEPDFLDELLSSPSNWLPYAIAAGAGLLTVLFFYALFRRFATSDMGMELDKGLSKEERAVLADVEGKGLDDDILEESVLRDAAQMNEDNVPTVSDTVEEDDLSVLDDDFDLESLGIDSEDESPTPEETPAESEPDSEDNTPPEEDEDPFASDEFDLSDDEIDEMLDDDLLPDGQEDDEDEENERGNQ